MNENIHNVAVATFQEKVKNHENAIIEGKKVAHNLNEFIELHNELNDILDEQIVLYNEYKSKESREELDSFLREELDYLLLIENMMVTLDQYHDVVGLVDSAMVMKEWEDVRTIVTYENLEKSLVRVGDLMKKYSDAKYTELYDSILEKQSKLLERMTEAEHNMVYRAEMDVNTVAHDEDKKITFDEQAYENLNLDEKIQYLEGKMDEIEHASGKKRTLLVDGERKNIAKKYVARYLKFHSMLLNLRKEQYAEEQALEELSKKLTSQLEAEEIRSEEVDRYLHLRNEMKEIDSAFTFLLMKANEASEEDVIHVTLPNGNPGRILKSDLNTFEELEQMEKRNQQDFGDFMYQEGIAPDASLDNKTPEEKKKHILDRIRFLRTSGMSGEALENEIQKLIHEYRKLEKRRKFITVASLIRLFMKQGYSKEEAEYFSIISYNPTAFQSRKDKSDQEKKNAFGKLFHTFSSSILHSEKSDVVEEEFALACIDTKKNPFGALYTFGVNVKEYITKVLNAMKNIPSKVGNYVSKIKGMRKPKNKSILRKDVKSKIRQSAVVLGFTAMLAAAAMSSSKRNAPIQSEVNISFEDEKSPIMNEDIPSVNQQDSSKEDFDQKAEELGDKISEMMNKNEEKKEEVEQVVPDAQEPTVSLENVSLGDNSVYIGDVFTTKMNADIYSNMYDASNETNGLHAYFAPESNREVTGLVYNYNGTTILLDENDPDFESQKTALESNGAVLMAVRSENEASKGTGVAEGYWNISDIVLENEEGMQR